MANMNSPDQKALMVKAAKAIDKDDKGKMGADAHTMFTKVKKVLQGKNEKSTTMSGVLEDLISGKAIPGLDKKQEPAAEPEPVPEPEPVEEPPKPEPVAPAKPVDNSKMNSEILKVQERLETKAQEQEAAAKLQMNTVVEKLRDRMQEMKSNMEKRGEAEKKNAVQKYMVSQKKVNLKIYNSMKTQLPK